MKQLICDYRNKKKEIMQRLDEFRKVNENDLFYELCFCILTPQSSGRLAWEKILSLKKAGFKNKDIDPEDYIYPIRFYKNKAVYLKELKYNYINIVGLINDYKKDPKELRRQFVEYIKGYGYKEASHSLRNIGFRDLAILDRHILKNLKSYNVISEVPKTLTKLRYLDIEKRFQEFSRRIKIPMDHLDLLFWSQETGEIFK